MATPDDVRIELLNNNDPILMYDGSGFAWRSGSLRNWLNRLVWDLLRFQPANKFIGPFGPNDKWGMRDAVTRIMWQTDQNNQMLRRLCKAAKVDITDLPG